MVLDAKAAEEAVATVGRRLGLDLYQAAQGILDIVNENMFGALRLVTVQQGLDPTQFALVAFGGAGPLHGNAMAQLARCYPVIVPPTPGVLSALGFLYSDVKNEFAQTAVRMIGDSDPGQIADILLRLGRDAVRWLRDEGIDEPNQRVRYEADVRYFRQGYEFSLEIDPNLIASGGLDDLAARFGLAHERLYGFRLAQPVELVNLRAIGTGMIQKVEFPKFEREAPDSSAALVEQQSVYFHGQSISANVYDRNLLRAGNRIRGPAIVIQMDSTTVIHPGHVGVIDEYLNILINTEALS
jgi:N-methylhydantoinase A